MPRDAPILLFITHFCESVGSIIKCMNSTKMCSDKGVRAQCGGAPRLLNKYSTLTQTCNIELDSVVCVGEEALDEERQFSPFGGDNAGCHGSVFTN